MFYFLCFCISLFWPGMVLNQGQLTIVVSDWEPYLGSFSPPMFCVSCFLFSVLHLTGLFRFALCFSVQFK